jgi:DNA-binding response OmpR family regulator
MLQRAGYQVELVNDGRAAKARIEQGSPPAVVLLDVMLPHVDGLQLVTVLRQQAAWAAVPVLMLSAKAQEQDIARALAAGATDYLIKPFQPEELLARVRSHAPLPG